MKWLILVIFLSFIPEASAQRIKYRRVVSADSLHYVYNDVARLRGSKIKITKDKTRLKELQEYAMSDLFMHHFEHGPGNFGEVCAQSRGFFQESKMWDDSQAHKKIIRDKKFKTCLAIIVEWEMYGDTHYGYVVRFYED